MFISGPMKLEKIRARSADRRRARLAVVNSPITDCSRTYAFTVFWPVTVSSMMPFRLPRFFCVSRYPRRVYFTMRRVSR